MQLIFPTVYDEPAFPSSFFLLFFWLISVCPLFLNHDKISPSLMWQIPFPPGKSQSISSFIPPIFFHGHRDCPLCLPGAPRIPAVFRLSTQKCYLFPFWRAEHGRGTEASADARWFLQLVSISCFESGGMCAGWLCLHLISGDRLQLHCSLIKRRKTCCLFLSRSFYIIFAACWCNCPNACRVIWCIISDVEGHYEIRTECLFFIFLLSNTYCLTVWLQEEYITWMKTLLHIYFCPT